MNCGAKRQEICSVLAWSGGGGGPGVSNRTKSNKNPIERNRTIVVRLGSAIEQNWTYFFAVSSIFEPIEQNQTAL